MLRKFAIAATAVGWGCLSSGCAEQKATGNAPSGQAQVPAYYEPALADQYRALGDSGYQFADDGKTAEALGCFTRQNQLIPAGKWGAYNLACIYGRTDQKEPGFEWLTKAVNNGWDDPDQLESDSDLKSLRDDPRFAALVTQARSTSQMHEATFAQGLPHYDQPPIVFPNTDSLDRWKDAQQNLMNKDRRVWYGWQTTAAKMDFEAKRLAALRQLKANDPTFDYGLERVRAVSQINSMYSAWGALSEGVLREVNLYLAAHPGPAGQNEAHYRAGLASFNEHRPEKPSDPNWGASASAARAQFAQVAAGTEYNGAAQAWLLMMELAEAGDNKAAVLPKIRQFAQAFHGDEKATKIAGAFFQGDLVASLWPIPLNGVDIDGQPVSLDDYKGKVLLVDFWATWCGPCRAELPHVLAAYQKYHPEGFDIVSVSLDYHDKTTTDAYREWITGKGMSWRHIYDKKDWGGPLVKAFMVDGSGIPSPFLIGRDGALVASGDQCRGDSLALSIESALKKGGAPQASTNPAG
ncbi:MAG: TlpA family protein disulfide reductase [candidate division Zixibacteria bacterium]|nr:TlpA family protein disulfide reductase [candidate division Zixibacteria bacterium]